MQMESQLKFAQNHISHRNVGILFCGVMKQNWKCSALWISGVSGGRRMKHMWKRALCLQLRWWLGDALGLFAHPSTGNLQHVKGEMISMKYQEILGINVIVSVRNTEAWASLDLPT